MTDTLVKRLDDAAPDVTQASPRMSDEKIQHVLSRVESGVSRTGIKPARARAGVDRLTSVFSCFDEPIAELSASLLFNLASLVMPMISTSWPTCAFKTTGNGLSLAA
jgi:hypothetical protein